MSSVASIREVEGRKDSSGQEAVIYLDAIRERMDQMISLFRGVKSAQDLLNEAVKAAAEASGLQSSVVRKFVGARAGEKYHERKRDASQLSLLFEEAAE